MKQYFELTPSMIMQVIKAGQKMTTREMMAKARLISKGNLSNKDLQKIITTANFDEDTVVERGPSLSQKPIPSKRKPDPMDKAKDESVFINVSNANKRRIKELISNYLTGIDQNLTDNEVYQVYNLLSQIVDRNNDVFNQAQLVQALDNYVKENIRDVSSLTYQEVREVIEEVEEDEYGSQVFVSNWPGKETEDLFLNKELSK